MRTVGSHSLGYSRGSRNILKLVKPSFPNFPVCQIACRLSGRFLRKSETVDLVTFARIYQLLHEICQLLHEFINFYKKHNKKRHTFSPGHISTAGTPAPTLVRPTLPMYAHTRTSCLPHGPHASQHAIRHHAHLRF